MSWTGLRNDAIDFCSQLTTWLQTYLQSEDGQDLPASALPSLDQLDGFATFRNAALTDEERWLAGRMLLWLRIRKENWGLEANLLPTRPDIVKSALFERLRSGREPLPHAPPRGLDCPWYAVVEDAGPHRADGWGIEFGPGVMAHEGQVYILRNHYDLLETLGPQRYRIAPAGEQHHYFFWLWHETNPQWQPGLRRIVPLTTHPVSKEGVISRETETLNLDLTPQPGIWLMQNTELGRGWLDTGRDGMRNAFSLN
jgi:hypothetical protein